MKNVISGAAGFIGSHLCDRLIEQDQEIIAIDNFITGHRFNIEYFARSSAVSIYRT